MADEQPVLNGLVEMTDEEYHSAPGISKSHLDLVAKCPMKYWQKYIKGDALEVGEDGEVTDEDEAESAKETEAMMQGKAIHTAILEPDLFTSDYVILPSFDLRTKAGRAAKAEFMATEGLGKKVLSGKQRDIALAVGRAVRRHPVASKMFTDEGAAEQTYFATDRETGALIKCRIDWFNPGPGFAVDVKSCLDASKDEFRRSIEKYRYYVQQPWYFDVLSQLYGEPPPHWVFLAVEKKPPYSVGIYFLEQEDIALGRREMRYDLRTILECKRTGVWPDYAAAEVSPISMSSFARSKVLERLAYAGV